MLQDYTIQKVLNNGGFSYVYLASDTHQELVAIKEYLPINLAQRGADFKVYPKSEQAAALFKHGLKCFFEEGLSLAHINHPNIVRVTNFFRANDTVYMVMHFEDGVTLQDFILKENTPPNEQMLKSIFIALLHGIREVHAKKILHLDIKPANIFIRKDGSPVLLDFGSARQTLNHQQPALIPSFTPGFAAPEQHDDHPLLGPWSDIYSIGATMYSCIIKAAPMPANQRIENDILKPASALNTDRYSEDFLNLIDQCLALDPLLRPQSVLALQKDLIGKMHSKSARRRKRLGKILNQLKTYFMKASS